jgi:hypothetical protein
MIINLHDVKFKISCADKNKLLQVKSHYKYSYYTADSANEFL